MILGVGLDLCSVERIAAVMDTKPEAFVARLFHPQETLLWPESARTAQRLAKVFAAKEAVSKACGTGIGRFLSFKDIRLDYDEFGRPLVFCDVSFLLQKLPPLHKLQWHLSLTDEGPWVAAVAVLEAVPQFQDPGLPAP